MATAKQTLSDQFTHFLTAADGEVRHAATPEEAVACALKIVREAGAQTVAVDPCENVTEWGILESLKKAGIDIIPGSADKNRLATCHVGITGADYAIADTGTLAFVADEGRSRSVSLLPPIHIALVPITALVEELSEVLHRVVAGGSMPSCLTLVTGPSRTADIEQVLTIGVHGPKQLFVILIG